MTTTLRDFDGGLDAAEWRGFVVDDSRSGFLIDTGTDCERLKLLQCPACGSSFSRYYSRARNDPLAAHIAAVHEPGDFGLSERGERR